MTEHIEALRDWLDQNTRWRTKGDYVWVEQETLLTALVARDARLLAEVERERDCLASAYATAPSCEAQQSCRALERAEAAEAETARLRHDIENLDTEIASIDGWGVEVVKMDDLRAVLAAERDPEAPMEAAPELEVQPGDPTSVDRPPCHCWYDGPPCPRHNDDGSERDPEANQTPAGGHTPDAVTRSGSVECEVASVPPAGCPTCSGPIRETVGMVCPTCGTDYGRLS